MAKAEAAAAETTEEIPEPVPPKAIRAKVWRKGTGLTWDYLVEYDDGTKAKGTATGPTGELAALKACYALGAGQDNWPSLGAHKGLTWTAPASP